MDRRKFLAISGAGVAAGLAGCLPDTSRVEELPRPFIGDEDSSVVVEVYDDFACPSCRDFVLNELPAIDEEYIQNDLIRYEHHDYPIPVHSRWSSEMANAARAVQDRLGNESFFDYKTTLYENQQNISRDIILQEAEAVGVEDMNDFESDIESSMYRPVIQSDADEGQSRGVQGTPTIFVNGDMLSDFSQQTVSSVIEQNLE